MTTIHNPKSRLPALFPDAEINDDEGYIHQRSDPYIRGYSNRDGHEYTIRLDGAFTPEQLRALADWIEQE